MFENIVMALVTGLVVPVLLEGWKNRRDKVSASAQTPGASPTPVSAAAAPPLPDAAAPSALSNPQQSFLRSVVRLLSAGIVGVFIALVISAMIDPDATDFTSYDAVLSVLCVAVLWFVLGKVGPLKYRT